MRLNLRFSAVLGLVIANLIGCGSDTPESDDDNETDEQSGSAKGDDDDDDDDDDDAQGAKDAGAKRDSGGMSSRPLDAGSTPDAGRGDGASSGSGKSDSSTADAGKTADGGGGSPSGDFSPCPTNGDPCKILPLGDSITYGMGDPATGSYRVELFRKALADGKKITFVGSQRNGPSTVDGTPFPANHEGYSGWIISVVGSNSRAVSTLIPDPALRDSPHIILLMAGTNDVAWCCAEGAPMRLGMLIDTITDEAPDALLVVAQLTPLGFSDAAVKTFNQAVPSIVQMRAAAGKHVLLVDMHTGFPEGALADQVHPNPEGYKFMASVWYEAIAPLLP